MKVSRKKVQKTKYAVLFAVVFLLTFVFGKVDAMAIEDVDTARQCTLDFVIPSAFQDELQAETIPVRLYRLASITQTGEYVSLPGYESLDLEELSHYATASKTEQAAKNAALLLGANSWKNTPTTTPYAEVDIVNNQASVDALEPGLYLVCMKPLQIDIMLYESMPYIISLPTLLETTDNVGNVFQSWNYDLTVDLKLRSIDTTDNPDDVPEAPSTEESSTEEPSEGTTENTPDEEETPVTPNGGGQDMQPGSGMQEPMPNGQAQPGGVNNTITQGSSYKTGDDIIYPLLISVVVLLGIAFVVILILEKQSKKVQKEKEMLLAEIAEERFGDEKSE